MKIGIIGSGRIGGTLARRLAALGHDVAVANSRGPASLAELVAETGAKATTVADAALGRNIVVVTIPLKAISNLPADLFKGVGKDVVIIDTGNYYPERDGHIPEIEHGKTSSRWVADELRRPVVKVFNSIRAKHLLELGKPAGDKRRIALPVAGDDATAKAKVIQLLDELGFDGVDAGSIDESWRQEPDTPVYGSDLDVTGVTRTLGEAKRKYPRAHRH